MLHTVTLIPEFNWVATEDKINSTLYKQMSLLTNNPIIWLLNVTVAYYNFYEYIIWFAHSYTCFYWNITTYVQT